MTIVAIALIAAGLLIDLASFAFGVQRLRGDGPSGVPVIGFFLVAAGVFALHSAGIIEWGVAVRCIKSYLAIHLVLQFVGLLALEMILRLVERLKKTKR